MMNDNLGFELSIAVALRTWDCMALEGTIGIAPARTLLLCVWKADVRAHFLT